MTKIIIKREIYESWSSLKRIMEIPRIFYKIVKWYYEKKGYEVEEIGE